MGALLKIYFMMPGIINRCFILQLFNQLPSLPFGRPGAIVLLGSNSILRFHFINTYLLLIVILLFAQERAHSQEYSYQSEYQTERPIVVSKEYFIQGSYHRGMLLPHHNQIAFYNEDYINGIEIKAGKTFPDIRQVRSPVMGLGLYVSNLGNDAVFGMASGLFMFFTTNYIDNPSRLGLGNTVNIGIGNVSKPYDRMDNPLNHAIGSHLNTFIALSMDIQYLLNKDMTLQLSPSLIHLSNGRIKQPNSGLNLYTLQLGLKHVLNRKPQTITPPVMEKNNKNRLGVVYAAGLTQSHILDIDHSVFVSSTIVEYSYELTPNSRLGLGSNLFYETSKEIGKPVDNQIKGTYTGGLHLSYEIVWNRLSFILQPGLRLYNDNPNLYPHFARTGIRYRVLSDLLINCSLKSNGFIAEYIEWGLGYNFNF